MKKMFVLIIFLVSAFGMSSQTFSLEVGDEEAHVYSNSEYSQLFSSAGIIVPENAVFSITEAVLDDGATVDVASMEVVDGNRVDRSFVIEYQTADGIASAKSVHESMNDLNRNMTAYSYSTTKYSVAVTARYNRLYSSGYYYQPLSLDAVSATSQNIKVIYKIGGWKYGTTSDTGGHQISIIKSPATAGQYYSVSSPSSYYYKPYDGMHFLSIETPSGYAVFLVTNT